MIHKHEDIGGGYCDCGAQRCAFRECDGWCKHIDGWVELSELEHRKSQAYLTMMQAAPVLPPGWKGYSSTL